MREREHQQNRNVPAGNSDSGDQLSEFRSEADRLSHAADDIVARLRTSDSHSFLSQSRQSGGQ
jgi:hypothetical protein